MRISKLNIGDTYVSCVAPRVGYDSNVRPATGYYTRENNDPLTWQALIVMDTELQRRPFHTEKGVACAVKLYHPDLPHSHEGHWVPAVIPTRYIKQRYEDWLTDLQPQIEAAAEASRKRQEEAELERIAREQQEENERKLREVLNNYGINDSDGWRGVNTKKRYSEEKDMRVVETYVRHLTYDDVMRLTNGYTSPPAARKATRKKKVEEA